MTGLTLAREVLAMGAPGASEPDPASAAVMAAAAPAGAGPAWAAPADAAQAAAMARAGLGWLARADPAALTAAEQAGLLRELERIESAHTAARARVLRSFDAAGGYEDDGHGSPRTWLRWQTRITGGAAAGAIGWMRRLAAHPAVAGALAAGELSASWGRQLCDWSDLLPAALRPEADAILLAAAAAGAGHTDLARLAEEMRRRAAGPDADDDGFEDRALRLALTFRGAGRLEGDLTPQCAAALRAVLDALGKRAGPEDLRTSRQREHDALEEACRRLIAAGGLPDRAGQPTQIQLHMTLDQLRRLAEPPGETRPAGPAPAGRVVWPGPAAAPGAECDATIVPIVTGTVDYELLDRLAGLLCRSPGGAVTATGGAGATAAAARAGRRHDAVRGLIVRYAADLLSGPDGLAARLRTGRLAGPAASVSLPLDTGTATDSIPPHLRRLVITRDGHCRFPGCRQPPAACQPHHLRPRAAGGRHKLSNLLLLCSFHHLIAVHRWGWELILHSDGVVTAVSPGRQRRFSSHDPPTAAA